MTLYFILSRSILPRIANVMEARQSKIDDDLDRAAASKQEADAVLAEYEKALAEGSAQAQGLLREAAEAAAAEATRRHEALAAELAEQGKAAEARIRDAREAAVANINQVAGEVAQAAARKLIGVEIDAAAADKAVTAAMKGADR